MLALATSFPAPHHHVLPSSRDEAMDDMYSSHRAGACPDKRLFEKSSTDEENKKRRTKSQANEAWLHFCKTDVQDTRSAVPVVPKHVKNTIFLNNEHSHRYMQEKQKSTTITRMAIQIQNIRPGYGFFSSQHAAACEQYSIIRNKDSKRCTRENLKSRRWQSGYIRPKPTSSIRVLFISSCGRMSTTR